MHLDPLSESAETISARQPSIHAPASHAPSAAKHYSTFKALGVMLWYPTAQWLSGINELYDLVAQEKLIHGEDLVKLHAFTTQLAEMDILEAQESYVDTFDRIRSLALHLFEHVHGDSRDRGQAMVDLTTVYQEHGFALSKGELPDYLPAFLEFLTYLPKADAFEMLADTGHILVSLGKRLDERESPYLAVFNGLIRLAGRVPEPAIRKTGAVFPSFEMLDKDWEDKPIDFMGAEEPKTDGGCSSSPASSGGCGGCGSGGGCGGSSQHNPQLQGA